MISKKDFLALATILAKEENQEIINSVVQYCKSENPRFKEKRFREHIQKIRGR
jgi:predicted nucleotidyltransferase